MTKQYGLKLEPIASDNYIFGASPLSGLADVNLSGDWRNYLVKYEKQTLINGEETYGCTIFGSQNQSEIMLKFLTGIEHNFDEQFNYNIVGVEPPGADPQLYFESQRKQFLTEGKFPQASSLADFKKPRPMTEEYLAEARKFEYVIGHEWLFTNNPSKEVRLNLLRTGLRKSPVAVSVSAWASDANDLYINNGMPNNHWVVCVAMEGDSPIIFDTYDKSIKKLHPDHEIQVAKIIYVTKKGEYTPEQQASFKWIQTMIDWIKSFLPSLQKQIEALPKVDNSLSLNPNEVYNEVKESMKSPKITDWAKAIAVWEGDTQGTNPGNLKYSPLIATWGGKKGRKALDGGYFATFISYESGFLALCNFLELGCKDQLLSFHQARTLQKFMTVYAGNPPFTYIKGIAGILKVPLDTDVKTFL